MDSSQHVGWCLGWQGRAMQVVTAADAARLLAHALAGAAEERLAIAYLDHDRRVLHVEVVTGDIRSAPVPTRAIAETALRLGAAGLIVAHNHPSGDARPSAADLDATRRLVELARALELRLHDHLIFGESGCHSFRAAGLL